MKTEDFIATYLTPEEISSIADERLAAEIAVHRFRYDIFSEKELTRLLRLAIKDGKYGRVLEMIALPNCPLFTPSTIHAIVTRADPEVLEAIDAVLAVSESREMRNMHHLLKTLR